MEPTPVEFTPPFCPRPHCRYHLHPLGWRWVRFGSYRRRCHPRTIPRFRCGHCHRTFRIQTFSTTYLPDPWKDYYWRRVATRRIPNCRRHRLKNAI